MACRQTEYAHRLKLELIKKLGGKCDLCPETNPDRLQFDHIHGRDWDVRKKSYSARMAKYKQEVEMNQLRLLCEPCNLRQRKRNDNGLCVPTAAKIERTGDIPF